MLVNFYGLTILTDPVLGKRAGADTWVGTIGAKRLMAKPTHWRKQPRGRCRGHQHLPVSHPFRGGLAAGHAHATRAGEGKGNRKDGGEIIERVH